MVLVHLLGGVLVVVGLFLFTYDQIKGRAISSDLAGAKAWSVNLSGPPALILVVFGALLFLFPFSPWWPDNLGSVITTTTTVPTTTTTVSSITTTVPPTTTTQDLFTTTTDETTSPPFDNIDEPSIIEVWPPSPYGASIFYDDDCQGDVIEWIQDGSSTIGWQIDVDVDDQFGSHLYDFTLDTIADDLFFGNRSVICFWDFIDNEVGYEYYLEIWAYNDFQYSQAPLVVEYFDG